jgi:hypothetical protein
MSIAEWSRPPLVKQPVSHKNHLLAPQVTGGVLCEKLKHEGTKARRKIDLFLCFPS